MTELHSLSPEQVRALELEQSTLIGQLESQRDMLREVLDDIGKLSPAGESFQLRSLKRRELLLTEQMNRWIVQLDEIESRLAPTRAGAYPPISNEDEFQALMHLIDQGLIANEVPIPARQLQAMSEASKLLKTGILSGPLSSGPPEAGDYSRGNLSKRIKNWFQDRYGDRLKVDLSIGRAVALVRGDAWLIRIPLIFGSVQVTINRDLETTHPHISGPARPAKVILNVLHLVDDLSPSLAKSLTDDELHAIHSSFAPAMVVFLLLQQFATVHPMMIAAREDLRKAAEICAKDRQARGFSRWHSLQAVEKLLKVFITLRKGEFGRNHNLAGHASHARKLGGTDLDASLLASVQCSADVRYDSTSTTLEESVAAHGAAVALARLILFDIQSLLVQGNGPAPT